MDLSLDEMILMAFELNASDIFVKSDSIPAIRQHGKIMQMELPELSGDVVQKLCYSKMSPRQQASFEQHHEMDLAFSIGEQLRIRMNIYMQRGGVATVCRLIPTRIRSLDELGIPAKVKEFTLHRNGLVLVTGPTGSGKTTTLAAMIDMINKMRQVNIITIEDPIEFVHKDQKAIVSQREVGLDTDNFGNALRAVVRQAPDVILIGEMRDLETMNTALQAAETGHLVFATVHTSSAAETLDRISNMYAPHERPMLWLRMSVTLRGVLSQKLLPRADGSGRVGVIEVMDVTPTIIKLLEDGKSDEIYNAVRLAGQDDYWGMQTMNQALMRFVKAGIVTEQDALSNAGQFTELKQMIRMAVTSGEMQSTTLNVLQQPAPQQQVPQHQAPQQMPYQQSPPQMGARPGQMPPQQGGAPQVPQIPTVPGRPQR